MDDMLHDISLPNINTFNHNNKKINNILLSNDKKNISLNNGYILDNDNESNNSYYSKNNNYDRNLIKTSYFVDENIDEVDGSNDMNDINEFIDTQAPQYKYVIRSNNNNNNNNIDLDNEVNEIVTPLMKKALANKKKHSKTYIQSKRRNQNYNNNDMDNIMIKIEKDDDSIQTTTRPQIRTKTKTAPTSTMSNDNIQNKNHNKRKTMKPGKSLLNTNEDQGQIKKQKYQDNEIDDGIEYIDYDYEMPQATADIIENTLLDSNNDSPIISSPKKTLYNKETFFNADMPNELFGDDSNPVFICLFFLILLCCLLFIS